MSPVLHNDFRSSGSYRVRIALNLKGIAYRYAAVHLNRNGGEQFQPQFVNLNPQRLVPVFDDGLATSQSLAIIEHLDEHNPGPPLLPRDAAGRTFVRSLSMHIACDIHPLNNLRVLKYLTGPLGLSEELKTQWVQRWIEDGLEAVERSIALNRGLGRYCFGDTPTMADCCLVPQVFSAQRFGADLSPFSSVVKVIEACNELDAFKTAQPAQQPDAE